MTSTFAGTPLDPLRAICRPRHQPRRHRPQVLKTPQAWLVLWHELLGLTDRRLAWDSWQAAGSSTYTEVKALAQPMLLWPHCPERREELRGKGLTPARLVQACELLVIEGKLTATEAATLEEHILQHTDQHGQWMA